MLSQNALPSQAWTSTAVQVISKWTLGIEGSIFMDMDRDVEDIRVVVESLLDAIA